VVVCSVPLVRPWFWSETEASHCYPYLLPTWTHSLYYLVCIDSNMCTFLKSVFMSWFCPALWWWDSNIYLVFSAFTFTVASILASVKVSVFFFCSIYVISQ
jgi:hypothetical protein